MHATRIKVDDPVKYYHLGIERSVSKLVAGFLIGSWETSCGAFLSSAGLINWRHRLLILTSERGFQPNEMAAFGGSVMTDEMR